MDERARAKAVVSALMNNDVVLARELIVEDEDPFALAWGASTLAAGTITAFAQCHGRDPAKFWSDGLTREAKKATA